MLSLNVTHYDDRRLCSSECSDSSVGVYAADCSGLCDFEHAIISMPQTSMCSGPALPKGHKDLPMEEESISLLGVVSQRSNLPE